MTIEGLLCNPKVNLEFHLHLIISVLLKAMISHKVSLNTGDSEYYFREKAALLLATFINKLIYQLRLQILQLEVQCFRRCQQNPAEVFRGEGLGKLPRG